MIKLKNNIVIPDSELEFSFTTSSGPGGQNVNKVSTRAVLHFYPAASQSFNEVQKSRIYKRLCNRINKDGVVQISSQRFRSQAANRRDAEEKLAELLENALIKRKKRKRTSPTRGSVERRLRRKKQRGEIKKLRSEKLG